MDILIKTITPTHTFERLVQSTSIDNVARAEAAKIGFPHAEELDTDKPEANGTKTWHHKTVTQEEVIIELGHDDTVITLSGRFRKRGFEKISTAEDATLPVRSTATSAGYDFFAQEDVTIEPGKIALVPTGIKAYMREDEVLQLYDRSSNPRKVGVVLVNSVGIIDSDYYNNEDNEGHIFGQFLNITEETVTIKKGTRIVQGVFQRFLTTDDDNATGIRTGGFGSTN